MDEQEEADMWCPGCRGEYRDGIGRCPTCDIVLVWERPEVPVWRRRPFAAAAIAAICGVVLLAAARRRSGANGRLRPRASLGPDERVPQAHVPTSSHPGPRGRSRGGAVATGEGRGMIP